MAKEPAADTLEELAFPLHGLNLIKEFEAQPQGTTPVGTNVRAYETLTQRNRGGSRPGLAEYINSSVLGFPSKIQHLNIIVDPTTNALLIDDDTGDVVSDPSTNNHSLRNPPPARRIRRGGSAKQPNRNKKSTPSGKLPQITNVLNNFTGGFFGPAVGGLVYFGPSGGDVTITGTNLGGMSALVKFGSTVATVVSNNGSTLVVTSPPGMIGTVDITVHTPAGTSPIVSADKYTYTYFALQSVGSGYGTLTQTQAFNSNVTKGNMLIVVVGLFDSASPGSPATPTVSNITDTLGNTYAQAGTYSNATFSSGGTNFVGSLSVWYATSAGSGANSVTVTSTNGSVLLGIVEYNGPIALDAFDVNTAPITTTPDSITTNSIAAGNNELVIGAFTDILGGGLGGNYTDDSSSNSVLASFIIIRDFGQLTLVTGPMTIAGHDGSLQGPYVAIGVSFKGM